MIPIIIIIAGIIASFVHIHKANKALAPPVPKPIANRRFERYITAATIWIPIKTPFFIN